MNPERRAEWGYREKVHVETVPTNPSFSVVLGTNPRASHVDGQGSLHSYVMSGLPFLFSGSPLVLLGTTQSRSILTGLGGGQVVLGKQTLKDSCKQCRCSTQPAFSTPPNFLHSSIPPLFVHQG